MNDNNAALPSRSPILRLLGRLDTLLGLLERGIVGGSIIAMACIMSGHVAGRLLGKISPDLLGPLVGGGIPGSFELTEILIFLITFVGVSYGVRSARHISMSAIYDQLSGTARKTMLVIITIGTGALMFYLAWEALGYVMDIYERGRRTSALRLQLWTVYSVVPIGFTLAGIQYWLTALRNLTTPGMWRSFTEEEEYAAVPEENGDVSR